MAVHWPYIPATGMRVFGLGAEPQRPAGKEDFVEPMAPSTRKKDQRIEFRTTADDRDLFARAATAAGTDLTSFANESLRVAAQRVLADRTEFTLSPAEAALWERINQRPARELPELADFLREPSVFVER